MRSLLMVLASLLTAPAPAPQRLTVLAAASLKLPLEQCSRAFERLHPGTQVVVSAAATGVLVKQLQAGAPGDLLVGAAAAPMAALGAQGLLGPSTVIARNALVVAVPRRSTLVLRTLEDLQQPAVRRVGIGRAGTVPAGDYAAEALEHRALLEPLRPRLVFGESVTQVLTYVRHGDVEAGFVYASDARAAKDEVRVALVVDPSLHAPITYPAAVVARSAQGELARAFIAFLGGTAGQRILRDAGLEAP